MNPSIHQQRSEPGRPEPSGSLYACLRQAHRRSTPLRYEGRQSAHRQSGYSLLELLIVLALLAMIATLTVPALRNPLDKSRLRSSARQVQSALAKAKTLAVREGKAVQFLYEIDGNRLRIERVPTPNSNEEFFEDSVPGFGLTATATELATVDSLNSEIATDRDLLREDTLADGVTFRMPPTPPGTAQSAPESLVETGPIEPASQWSEPVVFFPNGRTQNATILIQGRREFAITVELRGLTAIAAYSDPFRRAADLDNAGPETPGPEDGL